MSTIFIRILLLVTLIALTSSAPSDPLQEFGLQIENAFKDILSGGQQATQDIGNSISNTASQTTDQVTGTANTTSQRLRQLMEDLMKVLNQILEAGKEGAQKDGVIGFLSGVVDKLMEIMTGSSSHRQTGFAGVMPDMG